MRYLVLSDVHGNLEALRAVLAHAARKRRDGILFLGDAVGYGGAPNQVVERLRKLGRMVTSVRGNHDRVSLDLSQGGHFFNAQARRAASWTGDMLTAANRRYLESIPVPTNSVTGTKHFYSFDRGDAHFTCLYVPSVIRLLCTNQAMCIAGRALLCGRRLRGCWCVAYNNGKTHLRSSHKS